MSNVQAYVLEGTVKRPQRVRPAAKNPLRRGHIKLKDMQFSYDDFDWLRQLWQEYFRSAFSAASNTDERLLKADYHGCVLHVTIADNPTQRGLCGMLLRETRNTVMLLTRKSKLLTIPKQGSVFHFLLDDRVFAIFGDNFRSSAAQRVNKKYKANTVPVLLD